MKKPFVAPNQQPDVDLSKYLKRMRFYERLEKGRLSTGDLKQILLLNLQSYFQGKVNQAFIIGLGGAIHQEMLGGDEGLLTAGCMLDDLRFERFKKSPDQVDKIFRQALELLEGDR